MIFGELWWYFPADYYQASMFQVLGNSVKNWVQYDCSSFNQAKCVQICWVPCVLKTAVTFPRYHQMMVSKHDQTPWACKQAGVACLSHRSDEILDEHAVTHKYETSGSYQTGLACGVSPRRHYKSYCPLSRLHGRRQWAHEWASSPRISHILMLEHQTN